MASPHAKTVKLADIIHNSSSIEQADQRFARLWLEKKRRLLEVLREGDPKL